LVLGQRLIDQEQLRIQVEASRDDLSSRRNRLFRYGPVVVWAVLIFIGSGNLLSGSHTSFLVRSLHWLFPSLSWETLGLIHLLIRKAGHVSEYAVLAMLAARACRTSSRAFLRARWFWVSLVFVAAYALSDEFHQSFVPSRGASLHDSMIDTAGGLMGLTLFWWWQRRTKKNKASRSRVSKAAAAA
jgi:VanZ family protein